MGWSFTKGQSRRALIEDLTLTETTDKGPIRRCLKHTLRGNVLWTVWEITRTDGSLWRYIGCDLLQFDREYGGWATRL